MKPFLYSLITSLGLIPVFFVICFQFLSCQKESCEKPTLSIDLSNPLIEVGKTISLKGSSQDVITQWEWSITPEYFSFVQGTDKNSQNPVLEFQYAGYYHVTLKVVNGCGEENSLVKNNFIEVSRYTVNWTQLPAMPRPRGWFDVCVMDDRFYLAGGTFSKDSPVDVFDPATGSWEVIDAATDHAFYGHRSLVFHDKMVLMGGMDGEDFLNFKDLGGELDIITAENTMVYLDRQGLEWQEYDINMPGGKACFSASCTEEAIYLGGGTSSLPFSTVAHSLSFHKYVYGSGEWVTLPELPAIQTFAASEIFQGKMYFMGGEYPNSAHIGTNQISVFDLATESWESGDDDFQLRDLSFGQGSCVLGDLIICAGGISFPSALSAVQIVDPVERKVYSASKLPFATTCPGVCSYNGKFYVFGGSSGISLSLLDSAYEGELIEHEMHP